MNPVRIIVDSTADVTPEVEQRVGVVPLTIHSAIHHSSHSHRIVVTIIVS